MNRPRLPQSSLFVSRDIRIITVALATLVGLNEAIVLQQLWYWLERSEHVHDGRLWVYNTYEQWQEQFPWWSERTIQRVLLSLERSGLVLVGNYNAMRVDRTKWYSIDFDRLTEMQGVARPSRQVGTMDDDNPGTVQGANVAPSVPEPTSEPTREIAPLTLEERLAVARDPRAVRPGRAG